VWQCWLEEVRAFLPAAPAGGAAFKMIGYLGDDDSTTKRMLKGILPMEEEHADDLVGLLEEIRK
jgi:bacterioferritin (cytochrome b1)